MTAFVARWRWGIHRTEQLSRRAKTVALHLSCLMNEDAYCWASAKYIARKAGLSPTTVYRAQRDLRDAGWVTVGKRPVVAQGVKRKCNTFKGRFPRGHKPEPMRDPFEGDPFYGGTDVFGG